MHVEDEFDRAANKRQSLGAHRRPSPFSPWLIALVAVVVIAPLIGWGIGTWISSEGNPVAQKISQVVKADAPQQEEADKANEAEDQEAEESSSDQQGEKQDEAAPAPAPEPELKKDLSVRMLNGRGEAGFAGKMSDIVEKAGFKNVEAADYSGGSSPAETTIYYREDSMKPEAEAISKLIGGGDIADGKNVNMTADIVVVLR